MSNVSTANGRSRMIRVASWAAATPEAPTARLTANTNCRTGPLAVYDLIATYLSGKVLEVTGKSAASDYWYVADPEQPSRQCWLWGRYAEVEGEVAAIPVFTPPPTPTPSYDWAGMWQVWIAENPASMQLEQSGSLVTGTLQIGILSYPIKGTTGDDGREVNGEFWRVDDPDTVANFSWQMLDNLEQFAGSYLLPPPSNLGDSWCGARSGAAQPSPCQRP